MVSLPQRPSTVICGMDVDCLGVAGVDGLEVVGVDGLGVAGVVGFAAALLE